MAARHRFDVVMRPTGPRLTMSGDLDLASAARLETLLRYPAPVTVDAEQVEVADCLGVEPLVEAGRHPVDCAPRVVIAAASGQFALPLAALGLLWEPVIDVQAWDAALSGEAGHPASMNSGSRALRDATVVSTTRRHFARHVFGGRGSGHAVHMTEPRDEPTLDDVIDPTESAPEDHREHAKSPDRLNDDELAHRADHEAEQVHEHD